MTNVDEQELKACCDNPDRSLTYGGEKVLLFCHNCGDKAVVELKDVTRAEQGGKG